MAKTRMRLICSIIIILGLFAFLITDAEAKTNFAKKSKKSAIEELAKPAAKTELPQCSQPAACCATEEKLLPKRIGGPINRFLAFGCRLNYGLTNWALSDKCDIGPTPQNCP